MFIFDTSKGEKMVFESSFWFESGLILWPRSSRSSGFGRCFQGVNGTHLAGVQKVDAKTMVIWCNLEGLPDFPTKIVHETVWGGNIMTPCFLTYVLTLGFETVGFFQRWISMRVLEALRKRLRSLCTKHGELKDGAISLKISLGVNMLDQQPSKKTYKKTPY